MQLYCNSLTRYSRLKTKEVKIGDLLLGNLHPIRIQTMTTTDTMDTMATVEQTIRCINAGAELVRITAPSKKEAENLLNIKNELRKRGYTTPLVADIHFTPNAAEIAARIVEKVRVNPGNYVDKKKFEQIDYTDAEYLEEIERIRERFTPLIRICKEYGTAMRIGTNHGSLSDRIMSRYGDTPMGMVESAIEFLRIARGESYHNIVLSMKSSNPQVMVQAYRLLIQQMGEEFGECYPLHLGVTEAGDGEDGRVKSAAGIGTLLEDGIGDTIRVSLTEDPELEIPVCKDLVKRYSGERIPSSPGNGIVSAETSSLKTKPLPFKGEVISERSETLTSGVSSIQSGITFLRNDEGPSLTSESFSLNKSKIPPLKDTILPYSPFSYRRRQTLAVDNAGGQHVPVVIADLSKLTDEITPRHLESVGYAYDAASDKWTIRDGAADYIFTGHQLVNFALPGTLKVIAYPATWALASNSSVFGGLQGKAEYFPVYDAGTYVNATQKSTIANFVRINCFSEEVAGNGFTYLEEIAGDDTVILCLSSSNPHFVLAVRRMLVELMERKIQNPVILICDSNWQTADEHLIHYSTGCGALLLDGWGDGIWLAMSPDSYNLSIKNYTQNASGRNYTHNITVEQFINSTAFSILQATRTRISKTEYISCPSCGRTLFDLQETTAKIRSVTHHLKGVKIAIMGCVVNGPGEMADADFGYVGSGVGKITLYKGREIMKKNINSDVAVDALITLLKESDAWVEPVS
jgi:(E)-4-hydroxy-3-methylbut-2-enyl-diphosphate synthase